MATEFTAAQRQIFKYHDGTRERFGDPLRLRRRLIQLLGDPAALVAKVNRIDAAAGDLPTVLEGLDATEQLLAGARQAFELPAFDEGTGQGTTDAMVLGVLHAFFRTCGSSRTAAAPPPTSSPSTPPISATPPTTPTTPVSS